VEDFRRPWITESDFRPIVPLVNCHQQSFSRSRRYVKRKEEEAELKDAYQALATMTILKASQMLQRELRPSGSL